MNEGPFILLDSDQLCYKDIVLVSIGGLYG